MVAVQIDPVVTGPSGRVEAIRSGKSAGCGGLVFGGRLAVEQTHAGAAWFSGQHCLNWASQDSGAFGSYKVCDLQLPVEHQRGDCSMPREKSALLGRVQVRVVDRTRERQCMLAWMVSQERDSGTKHHNGYCDDLDERKERAKTNDIMIALSLVSSTPKVFHPQLLIGKSGSIEVL